MDRKRRRELALGGAAVLLVAIAAWSMQRGTASPSGARCTGTAPRGRTHRQRPKTPDPRSRSQSARSGTSGAGREHQKPIQVQAKACAAAAVAADHQRAAASRRGRAGRERPSSRAATAAADSAEVHRRHDGSEERRKADRDPERCTRHVLRARRRSHRRAVSDRADRRRINRTCVSRRTRAPNHQTNRTINRE